MPDSQPDYKPDLTELQSETLVPFNTEFCDLKTKVLFEEWATVPCLRIMAYLQSRKGKAIYSIRGIGHICTIPKSTVADALKLLVEKKYILKKGVRYFANNQMEVSDAPDMVSGLIQKVSGKCQKASGSPDIITKNNQINNKPSFRNNTQSCNRALVGDNKMPWEREGFKKESMTLEEMKALREAKGLK